MDQSKTSSETEFADESSSSSLGHNLRHPKKMVEVKEEESVTCLRIQKAEREKLRRDKLNEQFLELRNALDHNRHKSDKASILTDTIQVLNDLMNQVDRLKAEYASLSQESRELVQEKSELREENETLKSEIEILNAQYQHRVRSIVPWIPHYTYQVPLVAITQGASSKQHSKSKSLDKEDDLGLKLEPKSHASSSSAQQDDVFGKEKRGSSKATTSSSSQD